MIPHFFCDTGYGFLRIGAQLSGLVLKLPKI
jgi:hypothetical protein